MLHSSTQKLIDRLAEMTERGRLNWTQNADDTVVYLTEGYSVSVTPAPHELIIHSMEGKELERASITDLAETARENGTQYQQVIEALYRQASRIALGTEEAISTLLAGIETEGLEPDEDTPSDAIEDTVNETEPAVLAAPEPTPKPPETLAETLAGDDISTPNVTEAVARLAQQVNADPVEPDLQEPFPDEAPIPGAFAGAFDDTFTAPDTAPEAPAEDVRAEDEVEPDIAAETAVEPDLEASEPTDTGDADLTEPTFEYLPFGISEGETEAAADAPSDLVADATPDAEDDSPAIAETGFTAPAMAYTQPADDAEETSDLSGSAEPETEAEIEETAATTAFAWEPSPAPVIEETSTDTPEKPTFEARIEPAADADETGVEAPAQETDLPETDLTDTDNVVDFVTTFAGGPMSAGSEVEIPADAVESAVPEAEPAANPETPAEPLSYNSLSSIGAGFGLGALSGTSETTSAQQAPDDRAETAYTETSAPAERVVIDAVDDLPSVEPKDTGFRQRTADPLPDLASLDIPGPDDGADDADAEALASDDDEPGDDRPKTRFNPWS